MTLRYKFVLPINLILVLVLAASLAWEWRRQEAAGMSLLRSRLGEEARFIQAASHSFGVTPRLAEFLRGFCHAIDASSPTCRGMTSPQPCILRCSARSSGGKPNRRRLLVKC